MKKRKKPYALARNIIILLDIILALLIIFTSFSIEQTLFARASLTFGIVMLGIATALRALQKY